MDEEKILLKYEKVVTLAQRGEANEAANAAKIAASMREKYPWVHDRWREWQNAKQQQAQQPKSESSSRWDSVDWESVWDMARSTVNRAREFTQAMADVQHATNVADDVFMEARELSPSGTWRLDTRFSAEIIEEVRVMNAMQRRAFVEHVAEHYRSWLDELFLEED
jgi:hypothetical protein